MKIVMYFLCFILTFTLLSANFDASKYQAVEIAALKASPEQFKNKKICYESKFKTYLTTFPPYIDQSGFKNGKYFLLEIFPLMVPVMVKKNDEMNELIAKLPKGKSVKVYGKIQKFRIEPQLTILPYYYLELDKLEPIEKEIVVPDDKEPDFNQAEPGNEDNIKGLRSREKFKNK